MESEYCPSYQGLEVVLQDSKIRLLSEKEFLDQPGIEAENAPKELREHRQAPKVDLSKVASKLESPGKFESFIKGASHISQNEIVEHTNNTTINKSFTVEGGLEDSIEVSSDSSIGKALEKSKNEE